MLYQMSYFRLFLLNIKAGQVLQGNNSDIHISIKELVGREGFEPSNSEEDRFTVCCRWPLGYLPYLFEIS